MSTHNICFHGEKKKNLDIPLIYGYDDHHHSFKLLSTTLSLSLSSWSDSSLSYMSGKCRCPEEVANNGRDG